MTLLQVRNLKTHFHTMTGTVKAVDGISYDIDEGEVVGLVGESGCGKSVSQLSVLQLIPSPPGEIVDGEVIFQGQDLLKYKADGEKMRSVRGGNIAIIFQEPMTSLNPVLTIAEQLMEGMELHLKMDRQTARKRAIELLEMVGIPDPKVRIDNYPHQFSGGMRQRVMISMALSCQPKILIADEPTTAVDVTTQAQLLEILMDMVRRFRCSLVLVTHNLGIVARYANRIYVMYAGNIVESGTSKEIFADPRHPYTIGLLQSVPRLDQARGRQLIPILGMPPMCAFLPRCTHNETCQNKPAPALRLISGSHYIRCHVDVKGEIK
jgi:peptide/nickel transport system ATP-binding protein